MPARPKPKAKPKPKVKVKARAKPKPKREAKARQGRVLGDALQLDNEKVLLRHYYAGRRMESPNGGYLMLLGVRPADRGGSIGIFECSASSLRYELEIPKATRSERDKVKAAMDAGEDPDCPRHGPGMRLVRTGPDFVCIACGVAYAKAQ